MTYRHARAQDLLAALAPPKRFELVALLARGRDLSVSGLALEVGLSQSCTTRHLQALERAGLVRGVRDGKRVVFHLRPSDPTANRVLAALLPQGAAFAPADATSPSHAPAGGRPTAKGSGAARASRAVVAPAIGAGARRLATNAVGTTDANTHHGIEAVEAASAAPAGGSASTSAASASDVGVTSSTASAADGAVASPTPRESGNESSEPTPRPRARNEIEDFLL
jgi:DNA-binding transcriptional ArsR family regulator